MREEWKYLVYAMMNRNLFTLWLFCILIIALFLSPAAAAGISATDCAKITAMDGTTFTVITNTGAVILMDGNITIDMTSLSGVMASSIVTNANIVVTDTAAAADWTGQVEYTPLGETILNLTSAGGPTAFGETVTVSFTGAGGNPWIAGTGGDQMATLTATRTDGSGTDDFDFIINTPPASLTIAQGAKITAPNGDSSPMITITNGEMLMDGTITIDITNLHALVASGTFTTANVEITDTAAAADWTGTVSGDYLTLTSALGPTAFSENVTLTFTGAGGEPWIANTHGEQIVNLTATRDDSGETAVFDFEIETTPPSGFVVVTDFGATPIADIAPLTVMFTDTSSGNPTAWSWDFGDGGTSLIRNPSHTYTNMGTYTVSLTATNVYGSDTKTRSGYISALNGAVLTADTAIAGLTITNCGGPQTVTVDTLALPSALIPNNSVLEVQPPINSGLKNITFYAMNGVGFSRGVNRISGNPTGVHLVSEEIAPSLGFSPETGTDSSFNWSADLTSYPCNAVVTTKIWEGVIAEYDMKFRQIAAGNNAFVVDTAYTAKVTRTNFPSNVPVKIHMSVNSSWNTNLTGGPGTLFIWRISEDGSTGQVLPTRYLSTNPVKNLDYYEADSPGGFATFGLSSLTGNNNPFQLITLSLAQVISPPVSSDNTGSDGGSAYSGTGVSTGKAIAPATVQNVNPPKALAPPDTGKTEKVYTNANGVITQATQLESTDQLATISLGLGVVAKDSTGAPLSSITLTSLPAESLPSSQPPAGYHFSGMAYEFSPDGATFSPAVSVSFIYPEAKWGEEYSVQSFDPHTGTWQDLPTTRDPNTGRITAQVSHFCCIALFAKSTAAFPTSVVTSPPVPQVTLKAPTAPAPTAISNFVGMMMWIIDLMAKNVIMIVGIILIALVIFFYGRKRRRDKVMYLL